MSFATYQVITNPEILEQYLRGITCSLGHAIFYVTSQGDCICEKCFTRRSNRRSIREAFEQKNEIIRDLELYYNKGFANCVLCNDVLGEIENNEEED